MTEKVCTLCLDDPLTLARNLIEKERFHHAVVLERQKVVGVISDRDVLQAISPFAGHEVMERSQDAATLKRRVHQIMTHDIVVIGSDESIAQAAALMRSKQVSCLPVVEEDGRLAGILTIRDLLGWCVEASRTAVSPSVP